MDNAPFLFDIEPYTRPHPPHRVPPRVDRALQSLESTLMSLPPEELARRRRRWQSLVRSTARERTGWTS